MLFISHDLAVVAQRGQGGGDAAGRLWSRAARSLFVRPQHPYTRRLLASAPTMKTDRSLPLASGPLASVV